MDQITLIIYSHTDYKDIWPLVNESVLNFPKALTKYFVYNKSNIMPDISLASLQNKLFYDDTKTYPQKLVEIVEQINTPYIWLVHDVDILINSSDNYIKTLCEFVVLMNIDRCLIGMIPKQTEIISYKNISFTKVSRRNISRSFYTPYDVGPSIWKCSTLKTLMNEFQHYTYRTIETSDIQNKLLEYSVYAISSHNEYKGVYQIGRVFPSWCSFLHILAGGKWFQTSIYQDLEEDFIKIIKKHNINISERGITDGSHIQLVREV